MYEFLIFTLCRKIKIVPVLWLTDFGNHGMTTFTNSNLYTIERFSDKAFWRYMHKKPTDEFNTRNGKFFPFSFFEVILQ